MVTAVCFVACALARGGRPLEGHRSVDDRHDDLAREYPRWVGLEEVAVKDRQIGAIARLENAQAIFSEPRVGSTRGETAKGLLKRELLFGMPPSKRFAVGLLPRDSRVDAPERVDDFDREITAVRQRDSRLGKPSPGVGAR